MYVLRGFKTFCGKLPKETEGHVRTGGSHTIQGIRDREGGRSPEGTRVGKSLVQCNKDGNCAGNESPLTVNASVDISQFSISRAEIKESSMESKHLIVKCSLKIGEKKVDTHALIDCGATGIAFIDKDFVRHHQLQEKELIESRELEVIDGRPI